MKAREYEIHAIYEKDKDDGWELTSYEIEALKEINLEYNVYSIEKFKESMLDPSFNGRYDEETMTTYFETFKFEGIEINGDLWLLE